jgi:hypothetical protein
MMNRRTPLLGLSLMVLSIMAVAGCRAEEIRYFTVGLSTTPGNHIYVERTVFDNEWWAAGGGISGDWQNAVSTSGIHDQPMPREARVRWHQLKEGMIYEAFVHMDEDLVRQAQRLPPVTAIHDNSTINRIYLIVGMEPNGRVTIWLSNAPHENNLRGRVLHVVGKAQADVVQPTVPPE